MRKLSRDLISPRNLVGASAAAKEYKIDDETAVLLYNFGISLPELDQEKANAKGTLLMGIPTLISFETVQVGDDYGIIYENLESGTLGELIMADPDGYEGYLSDFVALSHRMHGVHVAPGKMRPVKEMYASYLGRTVEMGLFSAEEVATAARMLDAIPDGDAYLHLDYQPRCTRYCAGELTVVGMRDAGCGHPIFDLGASALSISMAARSGDDGFMRLIDNLDCATSVRFWKDYVRGYFGCTSDEDVEAMASRCLFASFLKYMTVPVVYPPSDDSTISNMQAACRQGFLPHVDEWIDGMRDVWDRFE
jgi:hypothetical protein